MKEGELNEAFAKFDTLKMAIAQHEKGAPYYDKTRLINIFNQLDSPDQERAKREYSVFFGKPVNEASKKKLPFGSDVVPTVSFSTQMFTNGMGSPEMLSLTTPRIWAVREKVKKKKNRVFISL